MITAALNLAGNNSAKNNDNEMKKMMLMMNKKKFCWSNETGRRWKKKTVEKFLYVNDETRIFFSI